MGCEDLLLYLCWHYRSHTFSRLIWLYDIFLLLRCYGDSLNWQLVDHLAHQQHLVATVYYCIRWCHQLFPSFDTYSLLAERRRPAPLVQYLMMRFGGNNASLLLCAATPRKRKIVQRLMVDSVGQLMATIIHLLFPSSEHLGRLYMENSSLPVNLFWLYYFLHPWFVLRACIKR